MDAVPSAFVFSLMDSLLTSDPFRNLGHAKELGRGYGRIAREVHKAATICSIETPGVFFTTSCDDDCVFLKPPVFKGMLSGGARSPPVMKNLVELIVFAQNLFFEGDEPSTEGTSMREMRTLIGKCRHVRVRELEVGHFPAVQSSFTLLPDFTTFFNKVSLRYQKTDSFREFLVALVEGKKLESLQLDALELKNSEAMLLETSPHQWLQETILKAFFQPQLRELKLSDFHYWASHALFDFLLQKWLSTPETFPETTKLLEVWRAPPIDLLRTSGFGSKGQIRRDKEFMLPVRSFLLPHPESLERTVEIEVFGALAYSKINIDAVTDDEFFKGAFFSRIRFRFNRGENAMYWRNKRTTPIPLVS
uniref:F-box domain-containing protein n=1 Tax=Steinernema glaseri TaxID=37863 RepID=A0A1I7YMM5_9BILA